MKAGDTYPHRRGQVCNLEVRRLILRSTSNHSGRGETRLPGDRGAHVYRLVSCESGVAHDRGRSCDLERTLERVPKSWPQCRSIQRQDHRRLSRPAGLSSLSGGWVSRPYVIPSRPQGDVVFDPVSVVSVPWVMVVVSVAPTIWESDESAGRTSRRSGRGCRATPSLETTHPDRLDSAGADRTTQRHARRAWPSHT